MTVLQTQEQIEATMYDSGIARATSMMDKAEDNGRADQNPYSKEIFRDYVMPIANAIRSNLSVKKAGVRQAHVALLESLDPEAVAFLAVRQCLSNLLSAKPDGHRKLAASLGLTIHRELCLNELAEYNPELYHTLTKDLARRLSKNERHRMVVYMMQAKKAGISVTEWHIGSREQVGFFLLELIENAGLIEIGPKMRSGLKYMERDVVIHPELIDRIDHVRTYMSITMPVFGPCVEKPKHWGLGVQGGFHTPKMRRVSPHLVRGSTTSRELARNADMPVVYDAANALQDTAWAINVRLLNTIYAIAKAFSTKEIVSLADSPKPEPPPWLTKGMGTEDMTPEQRESFVAWKHLMAEWYTSRKLLGTRYGRFYSATRTAETFRNYPAIHFVYFADSRGRFYPLTYGVNPQGSDLSKALLHFADALPLQDDVAVGWFHVQGANKYGFDKASLADRRAWVVERKDFLLAIADDPINNNEWQQADKPLQFLAWCFEYADYCRDPANFKSRIPISMDGSCNGLQNLSALFRDEVGGAATNLVPSDTMKDIYALVAQEATKRLGALVLDAEDSKLRAVWMAHGINRKAVKRSVMTTPYGVTLRSATGYIIDDYLREGLGPTLDKTEYRRAADLLMRAVWPAIGDVVVKGREAMDWLKKAARPALKGLPEGAEPVIIWDTPSGFPASQAYFEAQEHRINTRLHGVVKIKVVSETDEASMTKHASGLAPNFVHSMDAAHLHLTAADCSRQGIPALAMIHDDYGTHAPNAQKLYDAIRRQFVAMYLGCDPIADFVKRYPNVPTPPTKGTLDIMGVLESDYFFS